MTREHFHVAFMKGECVYSSSVKQCLRSVNHEPFPMQMTCTEQQAQQVVEAQAQLVVKIFYRNSSGERRLKFIESGQDDDNKKQRGRENIA